MSSTVIFLSNQQVQVVVGTPGTKKISVTECYAGEAPDGSIINGMIMDPELFIGFMKDFLIEKGIKAKEVILIVRSSKFIAKNIEIPILNEKKTLEFIEREFADLSNAEDNPLYGYIPIMTQKKMQKIYAERISFDFIGDYIDIFNEIGLKITAFYSGESSLIGLTAATIAKQYQTFVLQVADRMTLTTLLWVDGSFYYFNSARCFHEQGTMDYANDMARSVSQIIQFMQANQIEHPLQSVVLAGVNPNDISMYQEAIMMQGVSTPIEVFDTKDISNRPDSQYYLQAVSGLVQNGKWQNFLARFNKGKKSQKKEGKINLKTVIAIGATLAVMLIALASCVSVRYLKKKELQSIKDYNDSYDVVLEVARYDYLVDRNGFLAGQFNAINNINENLSTYPACNQKVLDVLNKCAANYAVLSFESFNADEGIISMTAKSETVDQINMFIKALMEQDILSDVHYTGYTYVDMGDYWNINVTCRLSETAGK